MVSTLSSLDRHVALLRLTSDIIAAHVSRNTVTMPQLTNAISDVYGTLSDLGRTDAAAPPPVPAIPIRSSVKSDHIVCLEDGRKLKTLKRYLMRRYGMTPADYRARWGLPADYPMVAPDYSDRRRNLARAAASARKQVLVEKAAEPATRRTRRRKESA